MLFVGDDWAEDHHDVEIVDEAGGRLARKRLPEGIVGLTRLHEMLADHLDDDAEPGQVVIGIETDRGPWAQALIAAGYQVFAVNPLQASKYRERHGVAGAKSDPGDAHVLAELVRLDRAHHRPATPDSERAGTVKIVTRAHQGLIWSRQREVNALRAVLREFYPAAIEAFVADPDGLGGRDAVAVLTAAPDPVTGARLTAARVIALLRKGGRRRYLSETAGRIVSALQAPQIPIRAGLISSYGVAVSARLAVIAVMSAQVNKLAEQVAADFGRHPDAEIYRSQPGLGDILGARVLAEFGDAPDRYADARARKNYSGMAPVTRTSGKMRIVLARHQRNRRLGDALYLQAFCALSQSPGARAYYDAHRARGNTHHQALRALANRLVGILHGCLRNHVKYDETIAWPDQNTAAA